MHDGVDLVASALQLDGGLAMLVIDRQHVDADARAQRRCSASRRFSASRLSIRMVSDVRRRVARRNP